MNWIKNFVRPKIRSILGTDKREVPENMWVKDPESGQMVFYKDLEANKWVRIDGWEDREAAHHEILSSIERFNHAPVKPCF